MIRDVTATIGAVPSMTVSLDKFGKLLKISAMKLIGEIGEALKINKPYFFFLECDHDANDWAFHPLFSELDYIMIIHI